MRTSDRLYQGSNMILYRGLNDPKRLLVNIAADKPACKDHEFDKDSRAARLRYWWRP